MSQTASKMIPRFFGNFIGALLVGCRHGSHIIVRSGAHIISIPHGTNTAGDGSDVELGKAQKRLEGIGVPTRSRAYSPLRRVSRIWMRRAATSASSWRKK